MKPAGCALYETEGGVAVVHGGTFRVMRAEFSDLPAPGMDIRGVWAATPAAL
ncbi:MAG: hypothetical protein AAB298_04835 [Pseudomonadota bacterium]